MEGDKDLIGKINENLIAIYKHNKMTSYATLHFDVTLAVPLFSINPEYVNPNLLQMVKTELTKISKIVENPNNSHEINYFKISTFCLALKLQQTTHTPIDYRTLALYSKALKDDKLSYISFMSSFETFPVPFMKPLVVKAMQYCYVLGVKKLHKFRSDIELQYMNLLLVVPETESI